VAVATGGAEAALAGEWASSVTGRPAPAELLARLSGMRREHIDGPREARRQTVSEPPADAPVSMREANGSPAHAPSGTEPHAWAPLPDGDAAPILRTPPPSATGLPAEAPGEPMRALASDAPAQGLGPRSEAAARLRLVSVEPAEHGAGLDELAAKVKRILDEEARRHGIDV
jgi:hypothetical protein